MVPAPGFLGRRYWPDCRPYFRTVGAEALAHVSLVVSASTQTPCFSVTELTVFLDLSPIDVCVGVFSHTADVSCSESCDPSLYFTRRSKGAGIPPMFFTFTVEPVTPAGARSI